MPLEPARGSISIVGMTRHSISLLVMCGLLLAACGSPGDTSGPVDVGNAAITAVIHPSQTLAQPGTYALGVTQTRDAQLYVPQTATCPAPTIVMLHGAGGTPNQIATVVNAAAALGIIVIVPYSRQSTWEIANQSFGEDVRTIDNAIQAADQRVCIDAAHIALAGFSDGASFALSLGVANGGLFSHVIAFSPGFILDPGHRGKAAFYVSHATDDAVLPFDYTQQQIVPYLRSKGFTVTFVPFVGGHTVTSSQASAALSWLVQ
jgi:phospholipase/carboxylesterase